MRVTIVDLEWYNHKSFLPNPKCMKISSYHKQLNDLINFALDKYMLQMDYDIMYVVRETIAGGAFPVEIDLLDDRVHLIGEGLKFYDRYVSDIDDVMAACRPDYLLYPLPEENKMANADIVQFFAQGKLLPLMQDYHNTYRKKHYTYVTDKGFWCYDEKDIAKCVEKLKKDKNVKFADGLDLDVILSNKNKLKMLKKLKVDWRGEKVLVTLDTDVKISRFLNFIESIPEATRASMQITSPMLFSGDHFKIQSQAIRDFHRYFKLVGILKQKRVHLRLIAPPRVLSPLWFYFEDIEGWTTYRPHLSFVEYMTELPCKDHEVDIEYLLNRTLLWSNDSVYRLMYLFRDYPEIVKTTAFIQWDDKVLDDIGLENLAKNLLRKEK